MLFENVRLLNSSSDTKRSSTPLQDTPKDRSVSDALRSVDALEIALAEVCFGKYFQFVLAVGKLFRAIGAWSLS